MVIMALASTRPMMRLAERCLHLVRRARGRDGRRMVDSHPDRRPALRLASSREPGAMTISALLLARHFYHLPALARLSYATIGLLFVNVSVGGTLTQFAAPPMVMAAGPWHWDLAYMFIHFGWKAVAGIVCATCFYLLRSSGRSSDSLNEAYLKHGPRPDPGRRQRYIPIWIIGVQIAFIAFIVARGALPRPVHWRIFLFPGLRPGHRRTTRRSSICATPARRLFPRRLVVHGGLQSWWLEPVLKSLGRIPLFIGATILTGFNDNAAITYLATLVPGFTDALQVRGGRRRGDRRRPYGDRQRAQSRRPGDPPALLPRRRFPGQAACRRAAFPPWSWPQRLCCSRGAGRRRSASVTLVPAR